MKQKHMLFYLLAFSLLSVPAFAEEDNSEVDSEMTPEASSEVATPSEVAAPEVESKKEVKVEPIETRLEDVKPVSQESLGIKEVPSYLSLGLAFDVGFTAGTPSQQGFSIPFIRLIATGDVTPWVNYSVKVGQTREVSSAMLPQLLPTEVKVDFNTSEKRYRKLETQGNFGASIGMFIPTFNPYWSKDLNEIDIPVYSSAQSIIFLPQDVGLELYYDRPLSHFRVTLGVFNGSGNFSLNTNNSRAVIATMSKGFALGSSLLTLGASGYLLNQSSDGTLNYKAYQLFHTFVQFQSPDSRFVFSGEYSTGIFNDSSQRTRSTEFGFMTEFALGDSLSLFSRYEKMEAASKGDYDDFAHLQIGPVIKIVPQAKLYAFWDYHYYQGPSLSAYYLRLRVSL